MMPRDESQRRAHLLRKPRSKVEAPETDNVNVLPWGTRVGTLQRNVVTGH